jgi:hypothetical protein
MAAGEGRRDQATDEEEAAAGAPDPAIGMSDPAPEAPMPTPLRSTKPGAGVQPFSPPLEKLLHKRRWSTLFTSTREVAPQVEVEYPFRRSQTKALFGVSSMNNSIGEVGAVFVNRFAKQIHI